MNKPEFDSLPYAIREQLAHSWEWNYDGYEDSWDELIARVLRGNDGRYSSDSEQLNRNYERVTVEELIEIGKVQLTYLKNAVEQMEEFLKS